MAAVGQVIENKYEILKLIGKGGMSEVYLAMDKNLNKQWAVKEIKKRARDKNNEVVIQSAIAEANLMKKLDHPCLPRIVDILDREDVIYVVMDYIEGEPLSRVIEHNGAIDQDTVIQWAEDLCGVLDYLHNQIPPIIYRDMKPANIMLQPNGSIKLIDFGIAREYKEQNLEDTVSLGTKGYAAPEQFGGKGQTDARTDIYCLGVTLYHLLTGKNPCEPPYEIYPIRYWNPALSSGLEKVILKCTQLNPADRYQNCAELLYAIKHYENADEEHVNAQKKKVALFAGCLGMSLISLIAGFAFHFLRVKTDNNNYENYMLLAEKATTDDEKISFYQQAIETKPGETEAYLGLVSTMKNDADFTVDEETILKKSINPNLTQLEEAEDYGDLAYEIGKLYWYYYSYGAENGNDNQITRMKSAVEWFDDACTFGGEGTDYYFMSSIYKEIGTFNKELTLNVEEGSDRNLYAPYFRNLNSLLEATGQEEVEIVNLEVYRLCMYSLESYARKFATDEITEDEQVQMYNAVLGATKQIDPSTDKTEEIKQDILNRADSVSKAIGLAYSKSGEGK